MASVSLWQMKVYCQQLITKGNRMNRAQIESYLSTPSAFQIEVFDEIDSTNSYLSRECKKHSLPAWRVAVAERQTAGRGRYQRRWESPAGCALLFSVLLRPELEIRYLNLVNLFSAYCLAVYLEKISRERHQFPLTVDLKWPNDLWVGDQKLCGILLEAGFSGSELQHLILGIGLNVNQQAEDFSPELRGQAVSLHQLSGRRWDRAQLLGGFLDYFCQQYNHFFPHNYQPVVAMYEKKVLFRNRPVTVRLQEQTLQGIFSGLTPEGYLILRENGRERQITAGDVLGY